jgi:chromosome segregation ATPase
MGNMFVWMLIFAGAAIGLLATFLIASERELKAKSHEVEELTSKLGDAYQPTESPIGNSEAAHQSSKLETEIAELKRKLEEEENAKRELIDLRSSQVMFRDQQQELEREIENLKRQLANEQERVRELETARSRLEEMERLDQDLRSENRRLQEEIARWQERVAADNETQERLDILRQHVAELQTKQASVIESHRQLQDEISACARLLDGSQGDLPLPAPDR